MLETNRSHSPRASRHGEVPRLPNTVCPSTVTGAGATTQEPAGSGSRPLRAGFTPWSVSANRCRRGWAASKSRSSTFEPSRYSRPRAFRAAAARERRRRRMRGSGDGAVRGVWVRRCTPPAADQGGDGLAAISAASALAREWSWFFLHHGPGRGGRTMNVAKAFAAMTGVQIGRRGTGSGCDADSPSPASHIRIAAQGGRRLLTTASPAGRSPIRPAGD